MFSPSPIIGRVLNPRPWHLCPALEAKAITAVCDDGKSAKLIWKTISERAVCMRKQKM